MKKQKIILITILSLCVILSITIIKYNRNIEKETKVIKQMSESEQISNYEAQINQLNVSHTEYANSIQTAKKNLATAITNQGINTSENDTFQTMTTNIGNILQARTSDADATTDDIKEGKTAYVNGDKVIGTFKSETYSATIETGTSFSITNSVRTSTVQVDITREPIAIIGIQTKTTGTSNESTLYNFIYDCFNNAAYFNGSYVSTNYNSTTGILTYISSNTSTLVTHTITPYIIYAK